MDASDRKHYADAYRALAGVLTRTRTVDRPENHLSYALGELARRVFVGSGYLPPDELLERVVEVLRSGQPLEQQQLAARLCYHADHLESLSD